MLKYCAAAAILGCGWFVVLLVPSVTREWLLTDVFKNLGCLVVASIIVALAARKFISSADSFGEHLLRAAGNSLSGLSCLHKFFRRTNLVTTFLYGGLANLHDTLSLYVIGFTAAAVAFVVVSRMGYSVSM